MQNTLIRTALTHEPVRVEIMDALMAEGKARHVAANLTSTPAKMTAEGRRLGIL